MKRRKAREYALQMLFQTEFTGGKTPDREFLDNFWSERPEDEEVKEFCEKVVKGTLHNLSEIDASIRETAEHWVIERMASVDRNILRLAAYEILHLEDIPPAVAMNEAIEIAKKFSTRESASFINGILDKLAKKKAGK